MCCDQCQRTFFLPHPKEMEYLTVLVTNVMDKSQWTTICQAQGVSINHH